MVAQVIDGPPLPCNEVIWTNTKHQYDYENQWKLNKYVQNLNVIDNYLNAILPDSDARFRPDRLAPEKNDIKTAAAAKRTLEERQREQNRKRKEQGIDWKPVFFEPCFENDRNAFKYKGGYWEQREKRVEEYRKQNC